MDPAAAFLMALGIWLILTEGILPNLKVSEAKVPDQPTNVPQRRAVPRLPRQ
jgi:hypothetical protein